MIHFHNLSQKSPKVPDNLEMEANRKPFAGEFAEIESGVYYRYGEQLPFEPFFDDLNCCVIPYCYLFC